MKTEHFDAVYALDPAAAETLTKQLTENLRRAISNGIYKAGTVLPGIRQMAKLCGTSLHVPIAALKTLTEDGLIKARPRIGCVVLGRSRKNWHGRVLLVHVGAHCNYNQNVFLAEVATHLEAANWRVLHAFIPRRATDDAYDLTSFRKTIAEKYDLCLLPSCDTPVIDLVRESGIPYMLMSAQMGTKSDGCIGVTSRMTAKALSDFIAHCREIGIRYVLKVSIHDGVFNLGGLRESGIALEHLLISPTYSSAASESFASCAYAALLKRFIKADAPRPDLIYFDDDYIARGGLWALERVGLRIPDDVKVVSITNRDHAPFYPLLLTRFEFNPFAEATKASRAMLRFLNEGKRPGTVFCPIRFIRGDTF